MSRSQASSEHGGFVAFVGDMEAEAKLRRNRSRRDFIWVA